VRLGGAAVSCPICEKRKAARFCPAKGEKICAVCCGTERENSIDCPGHCTYLIAAHRYEGEHERPLPADQAFAEVELREDIFYKHQSAFLEFVYALLNFCNSQTAANDQDVLAALQALGETHKTLASGIYYEKPPVAPIRHALFTALAAVLDKLKRQPAEITGSSALTSGEPIKDLEIFHLLVLTYRLGLLHTNGRSRARRYIEFLRAEFPAASELRREESRIIVP
jgi:hypothetical protein